MAQPKRASPALQFLPVAPSKNQHEAKQLFSPPEDLHPQTKSHQGGGTICDRMICGGAEPVATVTPLSATSPLSIVPG